MYNFTVEHIVNLNQYIVCQQVVSLYQIRKVRSKSTPKDTMKTSFYPGDIPAKPGIYIFRDKFGKIIYIGKAVNLRKRVSQYFQASRNKLVDSKIRSLINSIDSLDFMVVKTESEALLLESKMIREYSPYYNTLLRDDKRFFMIKLSVNNTFPRLTLARIRKKDGAAYFGPFPHGSALKQTIEFLSSYFKLRLCHTNEPSEKDRKYCLEAKVKKCSEPCVGKISREKYASGILELLSILEGKDMGIINTLELQMSSYATALNFEKAGILRDVIENIKSLFKNKIKKFKYTRIAHPGNLESLVELQKRLGLKIKPEVIDAVDISNLSDSIAVASVVSFRNAAPDKKSYRRYRIKTVSGINDFAMMKEVVSRRYKKESALPDLLLVDGGKGQLSCAIEALIESGTKAFPVVGLAKKNEEIFIPGNKNPLVLEKTNPALKLIMAIRDEAHRFAVDYNRKIRLKRINESILDDIPGVGEKRKLQLLKAFPSIYAIANSSPEEIYKKAGIGIKTAEKILAFLPSKKIHSPD